MASSDVDIKLGLDSSKAEKDASKALSGIGSKAAGAASKIGSAFMAGGAVAAAGVAAIGKAALDAYAQYEQLAGGVETIFKGSADTVKQYADQAYLTAGMSANQYMDAITSFSASLIQSLGGDTKAAAEVADMAVKDMADNSNKMGTSMDSIVQTYQSIARGNYAMLDNLKLGYGGTRAELERLVGDANKYKESIGGVGDLTSDNFADVVEAIHTVQTQMGITGATAQEAATTIEGSVNSMKAAWENWLTALGRDDVDMGEMTKNLVESVITAASNIIPRIGEIMSSIAETFGAHAPEIATSLYEGLSANLPPLLSQAFQVALDAVLAMFAEFPSVIANILTGIVQFTPNLVTAFIQLFMAFLQALPSIVVSIVTALPQIIVAIVSTLLQNLPNLVMAFIQLFFAFIQALPTIIASILGALPQLIAAILSTVISWGGQLLSSAVQFFTNFVTGIGNTFGNITSKVGEIPGMVIGALGNIGSTLFASGKSLIQGFIDGIGSMIGSIGDAIGGALETARSYFPFSPAKRGPFSGRGYTTYSGKALMRDFGKGMIDGAKDAKLRAEDALASVQASLAAPISSRFSVAGATNNSRTYSVTIGDVSMGGDAKTAAAVERFFNDLGIIQRTGAY